eukprot:jgi/Chrpa1/20981/Chrysochromulina_OHIO_Genome00008889-RA
MVQMRSMRMSTFDICGTALTTVLMILYSPFHERMRRSIRATRSIRKIRRNDRFVPESAKSAVSAISTMDMITMVPSSWFHPSLQ